MLTEKPVIAIPLGDPAGVGPEIVLKSLQNPGVSEKCVPVVIGDGAVLARTKKLLKSTLELHEVQQPSGALGKPGCMDYIDLSLMGRLDWAMGEASARCGEAAFRFIEKAAALAISGQADAVATPPISKEALHLAGRHYAGHTEIFAELTHTENYAMLLAAKQLYVMHVTTHMPMREACAAITKERVLTTIRLAALAQAQIGAPGAIAVAGLNAHCSENGLFGNEEAEAIRPAVEAAKALGINVEGPIPADTVFVKALSGQYGIVVAMYHDQGHIPVKLMGFSFSRKASVGGINCTIGLPMIRTSVDHGTAFDIAGKGAADESSLLDAIDMAVLMSGSRAPKTL